MANGSIVKSEAKWKGKIEVGGISMQGTFEVFNGGGSWDFLFRKMLLHEFKAIHNYATDEIELKGLGGTTILRNQYHIMKAEKQLALQTAAPICIIKEEEDLPTAVDDELPAEVNTEGANGDRNMFTQTTNPHKTEHVKEIYGWLQ